MVFDIRAGDGAVGDIVMRYDRHGNKEFILTNAQRWDGFDWYGWFLCANKACNGGKYWAPLYHQRAMERPDMMRWNNLSPRYPWSEDAEADMLTGDLGSEPPPSPTPQNDNDDDYARKGDNDDLCD